MTAVPGEPDVLRVVGLEDETHQTFFLSFSPNNPLGLTTSMISTTT
jgi:hypothetical protein